MENQTQTNSSNNVVDELTQRLSDSLPGGLHYLRQDIEKNIKAVLQASFSRMDLVTNEEFRVQAALLSRSYQKLELLEQRVLELEQQLLAKTNNNE